MSTPQPDATYEPTQPSGRGNALLVLAVFVVASCGLAYELIAGALASYLLGDSILQFSSIIGAYLFAMGIGSWLSRYVADDALLARFVDLELLVGLFGGVSAAALFALFALESAPFRLVLYALVTVIGVLVGMEIPLVMRVLHRRQAKFSDLVSRVLTFDYLGALAVSLLFPLVLAPRLGLVRTGFLFGLFNTAIAVWTLWHFRAELALSARMRTAMAWRAGAVAAALLAGFGASDKLTHWSERALFGDEIIHAISSPYQRLVVTRWKDDLRLYINGNLQFSSRDEYRYHEALVLPALEAVRGARRVLVLGGGDGLALRQILKYPQIEHVTLVDLDPRMTNLFSHAEALVALNQHAFSDPRVTVVNADAAQWMQTATDMFDVAIVDFPDPSNFSIGKLYSVPFYRLLSRHVADTGLVVIQATSPYFAPRSYWCVDATLKEAGYRTWPYHALVPSFGEWGFILAAPGRADFQPPASYRVPTRFLDADTTHQMFSFAPDMPRPKVEPNRLNNQSLVRYFEEDWHGVLR